MGVMKRTVSIIATIAGMIWMPSCVCAKDVEVKVGKGPWMKDGTLRQLALGITNDGDFQYTRFIDGAVKITHTKVVGSSVVTRTRCFNLSMFPSIADLMADEKLQEQYEDTLYSGGDEDE
jgi:hypothetical protein